MLSPLTGVVNKLADWVAGMKPGTVTAMASALEKFAPKIAAVATGLSAFAGKNLLGDLPVVGKLLGGLGGPLGLVVTTLGTLALTSPAARAALGQIASTVLSAVQPAMASLVPVIGELGTALGTVLAAGLHAVVPLVPPLVTVLLAAVQIIIPLVPLITDLANALAFMAPVLVPLIGAWYAISLATGLYTTVIEANIIAQVGARLATIAGTIASAAQTVAIVALYTAQYVVRAATLAWTAAQWLLNVALDANPIGIVIVALAALAAALVIAWTRSAAFRNIVISAWQAVWTFVVGFLRWFTTTVPAAWSKVYTSVVGSARNLAAGVVLAITGLRDSIGRLLGQIGAKFSTAWSNLVNGAKIAGGAVVNGLKSGITGAISGIAGWIKKSIVDPIVNAVKHFFGIHSPSTVMAGIGGYLMKGLFLGMVPGISGVGNLIGSVFGGFPSALAGLIGHGLVGIASLPGKALNAIMSLFGGGGNSSRMAAEAAKYAGHRYVWGGPANASQGFDCSSFVNMIAGSLGLALPGGFRAPSGTHGPSTTSWLPFGSMKRPGFGNMAMNDLYVNDHHMGIVTGKGTGFAARSTATGTGPQSVGGGYTILRFPGGGIKLPPWLEGIRGKVTGALSKVGGFFAAVRRRAVRWAGQSGVRRRASGAAWPCRYLTCSAARTSSARSWRRCPANPVATREPKITGTRMPASGRIHAGSCK